MAAAGASGLYVNPNTGAAQAGLAPFRNALINGDMRINQRGTSTNLASLTAVGTTFAYSCDRWHAYRTGFVTGTAIAQGINLTVGDMPFNEAGITTFSRISRISGNTGTQELFLAYNMESQDSVKYKNKPVTLSFYVRGGANFSGSGLYSEILSGTGNDQVLRSGYTNGTVEQQKLTTINTSWIKVTLTKTVSSLLNQIGVRFSYAPTGTAGAADHFDITGVQLELGSVATPFEVRPYSVELQMCMRYYYRISSSTNTYTGYSIGVCGGGAGVLYVITYPVVMRIAATNASQFSTSPIGTFSFNTGATGLVNVASFILVTDGCSIYNGVFIVNGTGTATAGLSVQLRSSSSGGYIAFDAEM